MKTVKKAKMGLVVKKLDWNLLAKDMLDSLFLSQQALSECCNVSQQSISNWKNRARNPGISAGTIGNLCGCGVA
jgi:DNA-binding transcriptional regulator YiaG